MIVKLKPNLKGRHSKWIHLSFDKSYECEFIAAKYEDWYVIKCDDGLTRQFATFHFLTIDEIRENKLKELGI
jgi:hypothetical protein